MPGKNLTETLAQMGPIREGLEKALKEYQDKLALAEQDIVSIREAWDANPNKDLLETWVFNRDDADMMVAYDLRNSLMAVPGTIRMYQGMIRVFLFCLGREGDIEHQFRSAGSGLIVSEFPREALPLLGPDEQIWVGEGTDGDRFVSVKPSPSGNGVIVVEMQTRYFECRVCCGSWDSISGMVSYRSLCGLGMGEDSSSLMSHAAFLVPVPPPTDPEHMGNYRIEWVHEILPNYLRFFGVIGDGYIRWGEGFAALAATLIFDEYTEGWYNKNRSPNLGEEVVQPYQGTPGTWALKLYNAIQAADERMSLMMPGLYYLCPRCRSHFRLDLPDDRRSRLCPQCEGEIAALYEPDQKPLVTYIQNPSDIKGPARQSFKCSCGTIWLNSEIFLNPMGVDTRRCPSCRAKES